MKPPNSVSTWYWVLPISLIFEVVGCGGAAWLSDECTGPYCDVECATDSECPEGSYCSFGHCTYGPGYDGGQTSNVDRDGSPRGDGARTGDLPVGDAHPGDASSGDPSAAGDGDSGLNGDAIVRLGDGNSCYDPDLDGYCPCCVAGQDCNENDAAVNPGAAEVCDGIDNDCNGEVDENVLNACGNCLPPPLCNTDSPWTGGSGEDEGDLTAPESPEDGTVLEDEDEDGYGTVTLASGTVATDFAWPASEEEGTISRIDTVNEIETARYATVLVRDDDPYRPYVAPFGPHTECQRASRSAVDEHGNVYIANRAHGPVGDCSAISDDRLKYDGSLTKIAFFSSLLCDPERNPGLDGCQCVDRNGNGRIDTSHDYDDPPNGITVPRCTGGQCATSCSQDNDCPSGYFCVRELYPSQAQGKCSSSVPPVAPCTGQSCAQSCNVHADCPSEHFCVRSNADPAQRFCSDRPETPEFLGNDDECVLWTRRIPGNDSNSSVSLSANDMKSLPRAVAIDKEGYIWVGGYEKRNVFKLSPDGEFVDPIDDGTPVNAICPRTARKLSDGSAVTSPETGCLAERCFFTIDAHCRIDFDIQTYGAVLDSGSQHPAGFGYVWFTDSNDSDGRVQAVDTQTGAISPVFNNQDGAYGITIDHEDRVWVADRGTDGAPEVYRLDPRCTGPYCSNFCTDDDDCASHGGTTCSFRRCSTTTPSWDNFEVDSPGQPPWQTIGNWRGRGITTQLLEDGNAVIWAIFNSDWWGSPNYLVAFDADSGEELTGLRVQLDGHSVQPLSGACEGPSGVGVGFGDKIWAVSRTSSSICSYDPARPFEPLVSVPIGPRPYTYSDFTGSLFRSFTKPQGIYRVLVDGCPDGYAVDDWGLVQWQATTPADSRLEVRFRVGATIGQARNPERAQDGPVLQPTESSYELPFTFGEWLEIEFKFIADEDDNAPKLHHVEVARSCRLSGEGG